MKKIVYIGLSLMLIFVGIFFSACEDEKKISLSVNDTALVNGKIELTLNQQPKELIISIDNYNSTISEKLSYSFYDKFASITKTEYLGDGKTKVTIAPLVAGTTTLRVTSFQFAKFIEIPVVVSDEIETLVVKSGNIFYSVKGGDTFVVDSLGAVSKFNFDEQIFETPTKKGVNYYYTNGDIKERIVSDFKVGSDSKLVFIGENNSEKTYDVGDSISIVVESKTDNTITTNFTISIIEDFDEETLKLYKQVEGDLAELTFDEINQVFVAPTFIRNQKDETTGLPLSSQEFLLAIPDNSTIKLSANNYSYEINGIREISGQKYAVFNLQALATQPEIINIKVIKSDFSAYSKTIKLSLNCVEVATGLLINDVMSDLSLTLYNGKTLATAQNINLQLFPQNASKNDSEITVKFFTGYQTDEQAEIDGDNLKNMLGLRCGEKDLFVSNLNNEDLSEKIKIWCSNLEEIYANFTMVFTCSTKIDNIDYQISNIINVSIKEGADVFEINRENDYEIDAYSNQVVLYVEKGTQKTFDDFVIRSKNDVPIDNIDIGAMRFTTDIESERICSLSQVVEDSDFKPQIYIDAKNEGTAVYKIDLASGASTSFKICVVDLFKVEEYNEGAIKLSKEFKIYENNSDSNIAKIGYKNYEIDDDTTINTDSIGYVVIKNSNYGTIKESAQVTFNTSINATSLIYAWKEATYDKSKLDLTENSVTGQLFIKGKDVISELEPQELKLNIEYKNVEDFKLSEAQQYSYSLLVAYVATIESIDISTKTQVVYPKDEVGYHAEIKGLHEAEIELNITPSYFNESEELDVIKRKIKWTFSQSLMSNYLRADKIGNIYHINDYGTFNCETMTFTFTGGENISPTLYFYAEYEEYDVISHDYLSIKLERYIKVDQIAFKNTTDKIYLDPMHTQFILLPVVYPENANEKGYTVTYIPTVKAGQPLTNVGVDIYENGNKIKISYLGSGGGEGKLRIVPITSYTGENTYAYSREIDVTIADGSIDFPFAINTSEELFAINNAQGLDKNYKISSQIDLGYKPFTPMNEFYGTIVGDNNAIIKGINISEAKEGFAGLFTKLNADAQIKNLKVEGKITLSQAENVNIGLICGQNYGILKNVTATLVNESGEMNAIQLTSTNSLNYGVGGLVGVNEGTISLVEDEFTEVTALVQMPRLSTLYVKGSSKYYVGGVAGINNGEITLERIRTVVYNNYGLAVNVNINTHFSCGSVAGLSGGVIDGLLCSGRLTSTGKQIYTGGIVAYLDKGEIKNCTTRVFVRSESYVAGIAGFSNAGIIENCDVESIYEGTVQNEIYNAQIVLDFASKMQADWIAPLYNGTASANNCDYYSRNESIHNILAVNSEKYKLNNRYNYELESGYGSDKSKFRAESISSIEFSGADEALLFYYQAQQQYDITYDQDGREVKTDNQALLNRYNKNSCPFTFTSAIDAYKDNLIFESKNPNVISISENGDFIVQGIGQAEIVMKSALNGVLSQSAKIYVTPKVDEYGLYVSSDKQSFPIYSQSSMLVFENRPVTIYSKLVAKSVEIDGRTIKLIDPDSDTVKVILTSNNTEFIKTDTLSSTNIFTAGTQNGTAQITSKLTYFNGEFTRDISGIPNTYADHEGNFALSAEHRMGIMSIELDKNNIVVYPSASPSLNVIITTNDIEGKSQDDFLNDLQFILFDDNDSQKSFEQKVDKEAKTITFTLDAKDVLEFTYDITHLDGSNNVYLNLTANLIDKNYISNFALKIQSNAVLNNITNTLHISFVKQPVLSIIVNTYASKNEGGTFSQYSNIIEPGKTTNYMTVFIDPEYASYDYIDITNASENYANQSQVLFTYEKSDSMQGTYSFLSNGIRLYKSSNNKRLHTLKYTISSQAKNDTLMTLNINAYERLQETPIYSTARSLTVKQLADVIVSMPSKQGEDKFVARGMKYLLEVNTGKYSQDQTVVYVDDNSQARVVYQNGLYYLDVFATATAGREINIKSYGFSQVDGKTVQGSTYSLKVKIMDFVLKGDKVATQLDFFKASVGEEVDFIDKMLEGLEIESNLSIMQVETSLNEFYDEIKEYTKIKILEYDQQIDNYKEIELLAGVTSYANEYFELTIKDGKWIYRAIKMPQNAENYKFRLEFRLSYAQRVVCALSGNLLGKIEKYVDVMSNSSIDNPLPIRNIDEFMAMKDGGHYILLEDIVLPSMLSKTPFQPIDAKIASFNGNNHIIRMNSIKVSEFTDETATGERTINYVGLFTEIQSGAVIKNVTIAFAGINNLTVEKVSSTTTYVGLMAGRNLGSITNCAIIGASSAQAQITVVDAGSASSINYCAGLVGLNDGYITNSRVEAYISGNANLAGLVGVNNKHISSSYVKASYIRNSSAGINTTNKTAGFVLENNGFIYTSYSRGESTNYNFYANAKFYQVEGRQESAGFVFYNKKTIKDCYSDIPTYAQSNTSGFVFSNTGNLINCISTSKLKDNSQASFYFYKSNSGQFTRCFYAKDINSDIFEYQDDEVVKGLATSEFADINNFKDFSVASSTDANKRNYIWFYPANEAGFTRAETEFNYENEKYFTPNRLELVSANISIKSQLKLDSITTDQTTNEQIYNYSVERYSAEGTKFNPYIISDAAGLEKFVSNSSLKSTDRQYYTFSNFRIVSDIEYGKIGQPSNSTLYKIALCGEFDGNNLTISNFSINTNENLINAGFFAQIGSDKGRGSVKNVVFSPKYINCPNVSIVGTVAGTIENGSLVGVSVNSKQIVMAKYIAGGVVGRASTNYVITEIKSNASASVSSLSNVFDKSILYTYISNQIEKVSYAGGIIGVMSGNDGYASNLEVTDAVTIIAKIVGIMAGGVVDTAKLSNCEVTVSSEDMLKAYAYGGYVAGHCSGQIDDCIVKENNSARRDEAFNPQPIAPIAVGGIAGIMQTNARITNCNVEANIISTKVQSVGGAVGILYSTTCSESEEDLNSHDYIAQIDNVKVTGNVQGTMFVGGIIGRISDYLPDAKMIFDGESTACLRKVVISKCIVDSNVDVDNSLVYAHNTKNSGVAGAVVGLIYARNCMMNIENTTSQATVRSNIYSIDTEINIYLGKIIGKNSTATLNDDIGEGFSDVTESTAKYKFIKTNSVVKTYIDGELK